MKSAALFLGTLFLLSQSALANECFDEAPVLDANFSPYESQAITLPTERQGKLFPTQMQALFAPTNQEFYLGFHYQQPPQFGIEYMLYQVEILNEFGEVVFRTDLTKGCTTPGTAFYPGNTALLPPLPLPGSPKTLWRIRVWGRMA